jgi:dipeptidyl-peptidase-4
MRPRLIYAAITILSVFLNASMSGPVLAQQKHLTVDDIFDPAKRINFDGSPPTGLRWLKDGKSFLQLKTDPETRSSQWLRVDALTGQAAPFYDVKKMEAAFAGLPGFSIEEARRLTQQTTLQLNNDQTAVLIDHANDLFCYELGGEKAVRLTNTPEPERVAAFSPDGRMVSYVRNNDLHVVEISSLQQRALTTGGGPKLLNGVLDWVYQEELYGRGMFKGYWWSPDSTRLAFLQLDESRVPEFTVIDHIPYRQQVEVESYPKAGDPNPIVRLGLVSAAGGNVDWVDLYKYQSVEFLIVRVAWSPDSKHVVYQVQDREQTWLDLNFAEAATRKSATAFRESSKAWIEVIDNPYWLKDGSFLWLSERNGWKHVYHYSPEGRLIRQVTDGKWEVRTLHGIDEAKRLVYFSGTEHSHLAVHPYAVKLDGTGLTRLSRIEGAHQVIFNSAFTHYIDSWSDLSTPTQVRLHSSDGSQVRVIDENRVDALKQYNLGKSEFLQVKTRDGFVMEALMIKPPDFDPNKKYPVYSEVYGGPQAPLVRNLWGRASHMWHHLLAQKGYIIWICDNRTASGKGLESAWPLHRNFGELELRDLEDGIAWLKSQPYIDGSRIGLSGWSFGGFMTTYALTHSKSFRIGIAGGSVTDWRDYDTIYTERYMGTPQNNPEGYKRSAPVAAAKDLHGKLLLIHGAMDDNVHMQNTIQLVYELQKAGKSFQLMLYPKSRHGVVDPLLAKHMRTVMTDFILQNL